MIFSKFMSQVTNSRLCLKIKFFTSNLLIVLLFLGLSSSNKVWYNNNFNNWTWKLINEEAKWSARAGLQVVNIGKSLYLMGGRTPVNPATLPFPVPGASDIWGDVWVSRNFGKNWKRILVTDNANHWPARAYFQAVSKGKYMYIMGGQNFNVVPKPSTTSCFPAVCRTVRFF